MKMHIANIGHVGCEQRRSAPKLVIKSIFNVNYCVYRETLSTLFTISQMEKGMPLYVKMFLGGIG